MITRKEESRMPKAMAALIEAIKVIVRRSKSIEEILKALDEIQSRLTR